MVVVVQLRLDLSAATAFAPNVKIKRHDHTPRRGGIKRTSKQINETNDTLRLMPNLILLKTGALASKHKRS